jgi:hypothetical protein
MTLYPPTIAIFVPETVFYLKEVGIFSIRDRNSVRICQILVQS